MQKKQKHPFNSLLSRTTCVSQHQKGWTNLDFNEARDDGVAVASTGPYANHLPFAASTSSLNFYRPDAIPDSRPTVSTQWKQNFCKMQKLGNFL